tara:strand:- start:2653 stop:2973 length:321 start_codon:yes stop_codon:yes gene_type:complete
MVYILEFSTTKLVEDKILVIEAMNEIQKLCKISDGYAVSEPIAKFGWVFFSIALHSNLYQAISLEFTDMLKKAKGSKDEEKFGNFMSDFFESRGCKIRVKLVDEEI